MAAIPGCSGDDGKPQRAEAPAAKTSPAAAPRATPRHAHLPKGPIYRTDFDAPESLRKPSTHSLRRAHEIPIEVNDGTCSGNFDVEKRFDHVTVSEKSYAVVVTVFMRPEPKPPKQHGIRVCEGVGLIFTHVVRLPHPLGNRALVDGAGWRTESGRDEPAVDVPATDGRLERIAEAHYHPSE